MHVLLLLLILLPAASAVLLMVLRSPEGSVAKYGALLSSLATLLVGLAAASQFNALPVPEDDAPAIAPRVELKYEWMVFERGGSDVVDTADAAAGIAASGEPAAPVRVEFFFGLDGVSLLLVLLTALLTLSSVLISWDAIKDRATEFYACLLFLETGLLGAFCAFDLLLFYVFFEFTLIPLFLMIGVWGGPDRKYAAGKFFIYTLAGSMVTLVGLVALFTHVITDPAYAALERPFSLPELSAALAANPLPVGLQTALFLALSAGFVIKVPLFPFHSWLPLAHTEAPTAGSVMLAGVLLKLGMYAFFRISMPLLPAACVDPGVPLIAILSIIGILYGSLAALVQPDIKKLVAYSSVAHLGFCMLGLFALNEEGITGGVLQMINHGLSTGALFLLVGMVYDRYHTRKLNDLGGLAAKLKLLAVCMVFTCLSSIGLPGLNGFVGEFLSLAGMFQSNWIYAVVGTTGVILAAWYLLTMVQRAFFGPLREPHTHGEEVRDMSPREFVLIAPILALCLWIGVFPQTVIDVMKPDVQRLTRLYEEPAAAVAGEGLEMQNAERRTPNAE